MKTKKNVVNWFIDFDEDHIHKGNEDYVNFRSSCGDIFVHEWDSKIYWKRKAADGHFGNEDNTSAKLRLANKAFSLQLNKLTVMIYMGTIGFLLLSILRLLPECGFIKFMAEICTAFTIALLIVIVLLQYPIVLKLRKKMDGLVRRLL